MTVVIFSLLLTGVLLNAGAQLLLKAGMNNIGEISFQWSQLWQVGTTVAFNPFIMVGFGFYAISVMVWLVVLSKVDVSVAYPMLSLGFIVNAFAAYFLFGENLSPIRLIGITTIILGVFIVARSS